jgi:Clp amino terminal domain, pathogenicity island component
VREAVKETIRVSGTAPTGKPPFTPRAKKVLELSLREALQLGHNYIGTEHILLGLVRQGDGVAVQVLVSLGVDLNRVRENVMTMLQGYQGSTVMQRTTSRVTNPMTPLTVSGPTTSIERVGKEWTARVVRAGRTPSDYSEACEDLAVLVGAHEIELDDVEPGQLVVQSVDTNEGPGIALSISYRVEDEPDVEVEDVADSPES